MYPCTAPYPKTEWFFIFEGSFLEAPQAVLFHATAIHGTDIEDTLFFVLELVLRFAPNSNFYSARKDREKDEQVELSRRKYSRRRVCNHNLAS